MRVNHCWVVEHRYTPNDTWKIWVVYFDRYDYSTGKYSKEAKEKARRTMQADREFYSCKFRLRKYLAQGE